MVEKPDPDINPQFDWQPVRLVLGQRQLPKDQGPRLQSPSWLHVNPWLNTDTSKLGRDICATVFFRFPGASSSAFPRFPSGAFNNAPFLCARHVKALHFGQLAMGAKWGMERRFDSSARKSWLTYLVVILSLPWR
uniref:HDC13423 n=1 Tax=Drosophila melanogaster TaxID=7227 RepID=Q6IK41_DROME|nr:TPA_inf: HDC13423 [Drosophila melanogaster]